MCAEWPGRWLLGPRGAHPGGGQVGDRQMWWAEFRSPGRLPFDEHTAGNAVECTLDVNALGCTVEFV